MTDRLRKMTLGSLAAVAIAAAVLLAARAATDSQQAEAVPPVAIGIDAVTTGNTATSLSSIQSCRTIPVPAELGLPFTVDIYVQNVSQLLSYGIYLRYTPGILKVTGLNVLMFQNAQAGSDVFNGSDDVPDQDGIFYISAADQSVTAGYGDSGTGVLARVTMVSLNSGTSPLSIQPIDLNGDTVRDYPWLKDSYGAHISPDSDGVFSGPIRDASIIVGTAPTADADTDGITDPCDSEGPSPNTSGKNGQDDCIDNVDNDGDGKTDGQEPICDADSDLVSDIIDLCPNTPSGPVDASGCSNAQVDSDGDGKCNPSAPSGGPAGCTGSDNCPTTPNSNQANNDGDALGDACDSDDDNDTVLDVNDNCQFVSNVSQANFDGDSAGDACDSDADGDGWLVTEEKYIFNTTSSSIDLNPCGEDGWAPDLLSPDPLMQNGISILDLADFVDPVRYFDTSVSSWPAGQQAAVKRHDLQPGDPFGLGKDINILDLSFAVEKTPAPSMLGTSRIFNATCPYPP